MVRITNQTRMNLSKCIILWLLIISSKAYNRDLLEISIQNGEKYIKIKDITLERSLSQWFEVLGKIRLD